MAATNSSSSLNAPGSGDEDGDHRPSVPPARPDVLNGGEEKCRREAEENEAVDGLDRAKQPPAVLEIDLAGHGRQRLQLTGSCRVDHFHQARDFIARRLRSIA
jgi:hypothetical protein